MSKPVVLSPADRARMRDLLEALPDEAAALQAGLTDLLLQILTPFEGRIWTEAALEELLTALVDSLEGALTDDTTDPQQRELASLMTRHAVQCARPGVVKWLLWAKRN